MLFSTWKHQWELSGWSSIDNYMSRDTDENNIIIWPWMCSASISRRKPGTFLLLMHLMMSLASGTQKDKFCLHLFQISKKQWKNELCFQTADDSNENITISLANRAIWGLKVSQREVKLERASGGHLVHSPAQEGLFVSSYECHYQRTNIFFKFGLKSKF